MDMLGSSTMKTLRHLQTIFLMGAFALTACTSADTIPNRAPVISSFTLEPFAEKALTARFFWEFFDADGDRLTCTLTDGAGDVEVFSSAACASPLTTSTNYRVETTYKQAGTYTASLKLEDGRGGTVTTTATVTVK
jgi:PKD domain